MLRILSADTEVEDAMVGRKLRLITGWALVIGAVGIFIDSWASWSLSSSSPEWLITVVAPAGLGDGSIGLIPAYIGATVGMIGFVIVTYRMVGLWVALLAGLGVIGMFTFWYSYPARATFGGVGSILIGVAILSLPNWGRLASPIWVASGIMGIPELVRPGINWGPIASFTLLGAAIGVTAAFVLRGLRDTEMTSNTHSLHASTQPAR
ncbi:MAG: hypothetical protein PVJ28_11330 [Acidimicrobiia bacterium]|jgi:hypothetical protein